MIERLLKNKTEPILYFYCKNDQSGKNRFTEILNGVVAQHVQQDPVFAACLFDICASKTQVGVFGILERFAETAFESQANFFIVIDGLDECQTSEAERIILWLISHHKVSKHANRDCSRFLFVGQRTDVFLRMLASAVNISLDVSERRADVQRYIIEMAGKIKTEFEIDAYIEAQLVAKVTGVAKSKILLMLNMC